MNIAQSIVYKALDVSSIKELSNEYCIYEDQDLEQEKTFFYFFDNSGILIHNNNAETF